jgi:carbonic anhydrase
VATARQMLAKLLGDNRSFVEEHDPVYFQRFLVKQHPLATVVTCADSRVHTHSFDRTPDDEIFLVRNIGNQIAGIEGSIEYGVHHLDTPLLIFIGHTGCGAIRVAVGSYAKETLAIQRELRTLKVRRLGKKKLTDKLWLENTERNLHAQVRRALRRYGTDVKSKRLMVVGAVLDLHNLYGRGHGRLVVLNHNGETDPRKLAALHPSEADAGVP